MKCLYSDLKLDARETVFVCFFVQRNSYSRAFVPVQMGVGVSTIPVQNQQVQLIVLSFFCISNDNNKKTTKTKYNDDNINNNYRNAQ